MGYWTETLPNNLQVPRMWEINNYAEIYADLTDRGAVIYALAGAPNSRYVDWLKYCLDNHHDIDEVFVQSLHWNRFLMSGSKTRDYTDEISLDYFTETVSTDNNIYRYTDVTDEMLQDRRLPPRDHSFFANHPSSMDYDSLRTIPPYYKPCLQTEPYIKAKLWGEMMTYLQQREYCRNLFIMDRLCSEHGIKMYLWSVNDRVYIPENVEFYGKLTATVKATKSAVTYLKEIGFDLSKMLMPDNEHYTLGGHLEIAHKYLPWVKSLYT